MRMVEANTIHPPHERCGTKSKISTKKARRVHRNVGIERMSSPIKYRGECEGACKCAAADMRKHTKVNKAAIGCTMRMDGREERAPLGREKSELSLASLRSVFPSVQDDIYLSVKV